MLQPMDNSVGERILGHCCGVWREVALQHLTGNSITTDKQSSAELGHMPGARLEISAYPYGLHGLCAPTRLLLRAISQEPSIICFLSARIRQLHFTGIDTGQMCCHLRDGRLARDSPTGSHARWRPGGQHEAGGLRNAPQLGFRPQRDGPKPAGAHHGSARAHSMHQAPPVRLHATLATVRCLSVSCAKHSLRANRA